MSIETMSRREMLQLTIKEAGEVMEWIRSCEYYWYEKDDFSRCCYWDDLLEKYEVVRVFNYLMSFDIMTERQTTNAWDKLKYTIRKEYLTKMEKYGMTDDCKVRNEDLMNTLNGEYDE